MALANGLRLEMEGAGRAVRGCSYDLTQQFHSYVKRDENTVHTKPVHICPQCPKSGNKKCPLTDEKIHKMWPIYPSECHLAMKRSEAVTLATVWVDLEHTVLSSQGHTVCESIYGKHSEPAHPQTGRGLVVVRGWGGRWG